MRRAPALLTALVFAMACSVTPSRDGGDASVDATWPRDHGVDAARDLGAGDHADVGCWQLDGGTTIYADCDGDGDGDPAQFVVGCAPTSPPLCDMRLGTWVALHGDCDDLQRTISSLEPETCNGLDDDCDGHVDEEPAVSECRDRYNHGVGECVGGCRIVSCDDGYALCPDATYACLDLATNHDHCGRCDRRCEGWEACTDGACTATLVTSLAAGGASTCAMLSTGALDCWGVEPADGYGRAVPATLATDVRAVATAGTVRCAAQTTTDVLCWGVESWPYPLDSMFGFATMRRFGDVDALSVGPHHACALDPHGVVRCWGSNLHGELGVGSRDPRSAPVAVVGLDDATAIAAGAATTCALRAPGTVACWGVRPGTTLVDTSATDVDALPASVSVAASADAVCAVARDGTVSCFGGNAAGQLGDGTTAGRATPSPVLGLTDAVEVAAGDFHFCALRASGTVACWGADEHGQLGDGGTVTDTCELPTGPWGACALAPVDVTSLDDAMHVAAGGAHSCAMRVDRLPSCWGRNADGELGDGTTTDRATPVPIASLPGY